MGQRSSAAIKHLIRTRVAVIFHHVVVMLAFTGFAALNTAVLYFGGEKVCANASHRLLTLSVIFSFRE